MPRLKLVTWNINGGYGLDPDNPTRLLGYENLDYFIGLLKRIDADVICLQEVHVRAGRSQAVEIARNLGLQGVYESVASSSHIDADYGLANAILTRSPFKAAHAVTLPRPHFPLALPLLLPDEPAALHDKLVQTVRLGELTVANTHLLPLHILGASWTSPQGRALAEVTADLLRNVLHTPLMLCGDFNYPDVPDLMPELVRALNLVDALADGSLSRARVDHILISDDLESCGSEVIEAFADHLPCVAVLRFKLRA
jgi:endonuclease/exonuclease/phosphatase family metal-dependent hydrolase